MLKALRWAYSLGVRNERHRIATYLSSARSQRLDDLRFGPPLPDKELSDNKKRKAELKKAVDSEVIDIIAGLFNSQDKWVRGESVMFPEGENNG